MRHMHFRWYRQAAACRWSRRPLPAPVEATPHLVHAHDLAAVVESGRASAPRAFLLDAHLGRCPGPASIQCSSSVGGTSARRLSSAGGIAGPSGSARRSEYPNFGELERPHDSPPVIRVHGRGHLGSTSARTVYACSGPRRRGAPRLAGAGGRRRRYLELSERCPEAQTGSADHDGVRPASSAASIAACARVPGRRDRRLIVQWPRPRRGGGGLVGQVGRPRVELGRVNGNSTGLPGCCPVPTASATALLAARGSGRQFAST